MLKSLQIEPEKCTGCLQCEMACSYEATGLYSTRQNPELKYLLSMKKDDLFPTPVRNAKKPGVCMPVRLKRLLSTKPRGQKKYLKTFA